MMNLKFMDSDLGANLQNGIVFGLETLILGIRAAMKQNVFEQTFSGRDCKSHETRHSSKEYSHTIAQTATKPSQTWRTNC